MKTNYSKKQTQNQILRNNYQSIPDQLEEEKPI